MNKTPEKSGSDLATSRRRECNKHDRLPNENDSLKICETCETHYYHCELCRRARDVPASACKFFSLHTLSEKFNEKKVDGLVKLGLKYYIKPIISDFQV
jgi:hypothetical protein